VNDDLLLKPSVNDNLLLCQGSLSSDVETNAYYQLLQGLLMFSFLTPQDLCCSFEPGKCWAGVCWKAKDGSVQFVCEPSENS
jgi:hypothetical protein